MEYIILSLSIVLSLVIILLIRLFRTLFAINELYLRIPKDVLIYWDVTWLNEFNIPRILVDLNIPSGSRLYLKDNLEKKIYLKEVKNNIIETIEFSDKSLPTSSKYDKYGINVLSTVSRSPRNCEIFLTPVFNKISWYYICSYEAIFSSDFGCSFDIKYIKDCINKYCSEYCFLECWSSCLLKKAKKDNTSNKKNITGRINNFCRKCRIDCTSSCPLYEFKQSF